MRLPVVALLAAAGAGAARGAQADPADLGHPLVLAPGQVDAELVLGVGIAPSYFAEPLAVSPDAWWGASERWTLGIVHSDPALAIYDAAGSVCVRPRPLLCDAAYHGGGLAARWRARTGALEVAPEARLLVRDLDPWKPAVTLGALARWTHGRIAVIGEPYLQLGLANLDRGNRARLFVPIGLSVAPAPAWQLELRTGYDSELAVWRDGYHVPAYLAARFAATAHVELGAAIGFTSLLGPQASAKERAVFVSGGWRS